MALPLPSGEMAADLAKTASLPEFLSTVRELRETPLPRKAAVLQQVASIGYLESHGITFPEGSRISPRNFEDPEEARAGGASSFYRPKLNFPIVSFVNGLGTVACPGFIITVTEETSQTTAARMTPEALPESRAIIQSTIRQNLEEIKAFVATPEVQRLLEDLYALPEADRPQFVLDVVMDAEARARRGIIVPDNMVIQRSAFADGRPTLFCVSKLIPLAYPWRKVTVTFDSAKK